MKNNLLRVLCALFVLLLNSAEASAQSRTDAMAERRLLEAETFFQQNDYEMGASRIVEACTLMRSSQQTGSNFIQIASSKADLIDTKLKASLAKKDYSSCSKLIEAEKRLLSSLSNWDPQNPKWHYQIAVLYKTESSLPATGMTAALANRLGINSSIPNQFNFQPLQNSIMECDRVLGMANSSYNTAANQLKTSCLNEIQKRNGTMKQLNADFYRHQPKGIPPPGMYPHNDTPATEHYCSKCGGSHSSWVCPFTHGG